MLLNAAKKIPSSCSQRNKSLHFTLAVVQHSLVRNRAKFAGQPHYDELPLIRVTLSLLLRCGQTFLTE